MNIRFKCPCGKQWAVAEENAGKKAKCRQCGAVVVVPAASADAPVERPPPTQAAPAPSSPAGDCPSCGKWLDAGQVVCLECGFHRGKGARLALASEKPDPVSTEEPEPDDERWLDSEKFRDLLLRLPILVLSVLAVAPVCFVCWPIIRNIPILAVVTTGILSSGLFVLGPLGSLAGIVLGLLAVCRPAVRARGRLCLGLSLGAALLWSVEILPVITAGSSHIQDRSGQHADLPTQWQIRDCLNQNLPRKGYKIDRFEAIHTKGGSITVLGPILNQDGHEDGNFAGTVTLADASMGTTEKCEVEYFFD